MYKKLHIQKLNPPEIYVQLANAPDEIANSNFSGKILKMSACYSACDNYIYLDRQLRNTSREETQKECYKNGFRKLYLK